jgi:hypothetical protein
VVRLVGVDDVDLSDDPEVATDAATPDVSDPAAAVERIATDTEQTAAACGDRDLRSGGRVGPSARIAKGSLLRPHHGPREHAGA